MSEPKTIVAGYSTEWTRSLPDFPTATHTLQYAFRKLDGSGEAAIFVAEPDGTFAYKLTLAPSDTADLVGEYQIVGYITDDATNGETTKKVVYQSTIEVKLDPLADDAGDRRTHVRRTRDLLRKAMEDLASGTLASASVNGKNYSKRQLSEVRSELARYEELLRAEEGNTGSKNIFVRFGRTS